MIRLVIVVGGLVSLTISPCKLVPSSRVGSVATFAVAFPHVVRTLASDLMVLIF